MELKTYVCPNCGANTTNSKNCDYCGSLLVRFVEKSINIDSVPAINQYDWSTELIDNLKKNLQLQYDNPDGTEVKTNICGGQVDISVFSPANKVWTWADKTEIEEFNSIDRGLIITLTFFDYRTLLGTRPLQYQKKLNIQDQYQRNFKNLELHSLFTAHESRMSDMGYNITYTEYAIDFGQDAEGAAKLISRILTKVYGISMNDTNIRITTNAGEENIIKAEEEIRSAYTGVDKDFERYETWGGIIAIIVLILCVFMKCT